MFACPFDFCSRGARQKTVIFEDRIGADDPIFSAQTQNAMEEWTIGNVRAALEKGKLNSIVPEQEDMQP